MITYEWDFETLNLKGDIINHTHSDKLINFSKHDITPVLVLVRNRYDKFNQLKDRLWAYVVNGKLPKYFTDAIDEPVCKVPKKFHTELYNYLNLNK